VQQGVEELVIVGNMSHMCVEGTARAAADLGYPVKVIHDACATLDLEFNGQRIAAAQVHSTAMAALAFAYASVLSTEQFLATGQATSA
jgi:nicotinamidase-related amidase